MSERIQSGLKQLDFMREQFTATLPLAQGTHKLMVTLPDTRAMVINGEGMIYTRMSGGVFGKRPVRS